MIFNQTLLLMCDLVDRLHFLGSFYAVSHSLWTDLTMGEV